MPFEIILFLVIIFISVVTVWVYSRGYNPLGAFFVPPMPAIILGAVGVLYFWASILFELPFIDIWPPPD